MTDLMVGIRITELPHKLPHYVALLSLLSRSTITPLRSSAPVPQPLPVGAGLPAKPDPEEIARVDEDIVLPSAEPSAINVGRLVLQDMIKACQVYLDERKWRNVRYCVSLFVLGSET